MPARPQVRTLSPPVFPNSSMTAFDAVWLDVNVATVPVGAGPYGIVSDAAVAVRDGRVVWVGPQKQLDGAKREGAVEHSCGGRWLTAGLVDCHTHLVFAGTRASEFERLLDGELYAEIAASGGGIRSTVRQTRASTEDALFVQAVPRVRELMRSGVTTVEIKSGYGLDLDTEVKMLQVAGRLDAELPVSVRRTLLAAHAVPEEFDGDPDAYVDFVIGDVLPGVVRGGLAEQVDVFAETIAFSVDQARRTLVAGREAGLGLRIHADQLSNSGGAALAAELHAHSADHVEHSTAAAIREMAAAGVAAVLLPGAYYTLGEALRGGKRPDIETMRREGVAMAVATDLNPGSSPLRSLTGAMNLACTLFGLRPHEALAGVTAVASRVLGLSDRGAIAPGLRADFALWSVEHPRELSYWVGGVAADQVVVGGEVASL